MPCYCPLYKKNKMTNETMSLPCGKCPDCKNRRINGWAFRLEQQQKVSHNCHFITLTYATEHVPFTKNGLKSLDKRDIQLMFKKLRNLNKMKIKYFLCGEYGSKTMRPHYHMIVFNVDIETFPKAWDKGEIHFGDAEGGAIRYSLKYIHKEKKVPFFNGDDRLPEFQLMSKGLGANYMTKEMIKWHSKDIENRHYIPLEDGKKIAMPRYYKDKIYTDAQKRALSFKISIQSQNQPELSPIQNRAKFEAQKRDFEQLKSKSSKNDKF